MSSIDRGAAVAAATMAAVLALSAVHAQTLRPGVPPAVLKAFEQAYPGATITGTQQERERNRAVLRVDSIDKGRRRSVLYEPHGAVVEVAEQVTEREVPEPVLAAMRSHRRAIFVEATKVTRGRIVAYHLTVRGSRRTRMVAKPDGTVVSFQ